MNGRERLKTGQDLLYLITRLRTKCMTPIFRFLNFWIEKYVLVIFGTINSLVRKGGAKSLIVEINDWFWLISKDFWEKKDWFWLISQKSKFWNWLILIDFVFFFQIDFIFLQSLIFFKSLILKINDFENQWFWLILK